MHSAHSDQSMNLKVITMNPNLSDHACLPYQNNLDQSVPHHLNMTKVQEAMCDLHLFRVQDICTTKCKTINFLDIVHVQAINIMATVSSEIKVKQGECRALWGKVRDGVAVLCSCVLAEQQLCTPQL